MAPTPVSNDFYIGLILAASSSLFIGSSFIVKKKGLLKLQLRAGQGGFGYLKEGTWWAGFLLMGIGECANFMAYAFAPATLVTPLGALSVLVTAVLASHLLNEQLNLLGKVGCAICVLGSTVLVIHAPKEQELNTMEELMAYIANPMFVLYVVAVGIAAIVLIFFVSPKHGNRNPLVYTLVVGTVGSLSVLGCKGLGIAIKETLSGHSQLGNWLTWIILFSVVCNITLQMNYLNKALDTFNTAIVTPILYVIFTSFVILASSILFKEWQMLGPLDIVGNISGFLIIVIGVFLLQAFKDYTISLANLPQFLKDSSVDVENVNESSVGLLSQDKNVRTSPPAPSESTRVAHIPPQHARTSSFTFNNDAYATTSSSSPKHHRKMQQLHHARSLSYNKLMSSLQVSHARSPSFTGTAAEIPHEGPITGYVKTDRPPHPQHKRTSSSSSDKILYHKRTVSGSGTSKVTGHVRTSSKTYLH